MVDISIVNRDFLHIYRTSIHWIGLRENLNRKPMGFYHHSYRAFRFQFSHHPILLSMAVQCASFFSNTKKASRSSTSYTSSTSARVISNSLSISMGCKASFLARHHYHQRLPSCSIKLHEIKRLVVSKGAILGQSRAPRWSREKWKMKRPGPLCSFPLGIPNDTWFPLGIPSGELTKSYGKWPFIVDFPNKNGDFP